MSENMETVSTRENTSLVVVGVGPDLWSFSLLLHQKNTAVQQVVLVRQFVMDKQTNLIEQRQML